MANPSPARNVSSFRFIPGLRNLEVLSAHLSEFKFPVHFHETYVLEFVISGADRCVASGQVACSGQLLVHGPRVAHAGQAGTRQPLVYRACYPEPALVAEVLGVSVSQLPEIGTVTLESRALERAVEVLFVELDKGHASDAVRRSLREVFLRVFEYCSGQISSKDAQGVPLAIQQASQHLINHCRRNVTTQELAEVCGLSRFHLIREFKRALQITPRQFLISQRVSYARGLLNAGMPIAEVAYASGFVDQSHLSRQFKRLVSLSPGQFRSAITEDSNPVQEPPLGLI